MEDYRKGRPFLEEKNQTGDLVSLHMEEAEVLSNFFGKCYSYTQVTEGKDQDWENEKLHAVGENKV